MTDRDLLRATLRFALPLMVLSNFGALVLLLILVGQWEPMLAAPVSFVGVFLFAVVGAVAMYFSCRMLKPDWRSLRMGLVLGPVAGTLIGLGASVLHGDLLPMLLGLCAGYSYGVVTGAVIGFVARDLAHFSPRGILRYSLVFTVAVILHLPYTALGALQESIEQQFGYGAEALFEWGWFGLSLVLIWLLSRLVKRLMPVSEVA